MLDFHYVTYISTTLPQWSSRGKFHYGVFFTIGLVKLVLLFIKNSKFGKSTEIKDIIGIIH